MGHAAPVWQKSKRGDCFHMVRIAPKMFPVLCTNDCAIACKGSGHELGTTWDVNQRWRSRQDKYSTVEISLFLGYYEIMDGKARNNNV